MKELVSKAMEQGGRLRVRSALNPALWLCAIVSLPLFLISNFATSPNMLLLMTACIPVGIASIGFLFLMIFDRDKLQSEDYQIRKRSLEIIEQSDGLKVEVEDIQLIANPNNDSET